MLPLGYQPSPMTLCWSSRADLLFHYHRASRSTERRHHYPSGLMRLSGCRKRSGNYCRCSFQPGDVTRAERGGGELVQTDTLCKGCINAELNMKNRNVFPFIGNVESISEANKDILDVLITLPVKEVTRVTTLAICVNNLCQNDTESAKKHNLVSFEKPSLSLQVRTVFYLPVMSGQRFHFRK